MANANGWGDGASNNNIGWGKGADNAIGWGSVYSVSSAGLTDIIGSVPATPLLLDTYTDAAVAYSLRKLRTAYSGSAIRVRRSVDNAEQDIAFVGNDLDTASLLTFCGAGNGFVTTWYDQSTNANNSTQATAANQAQVVLNGNLILDVDTNKITTTWTADSYSLTNSIAIAQGNYQIGVFRRQTTATRIISLASTLSTPLIGVWGITDVISTNYGGGAINHQTNTGTGKYLLSVFRDTSNNVSAYLNNTALTGGTDSTTGQNITRLGVSGASPTVGQKQELVYWNNDQSANRTGIETNVNTYWNAY